MNTIHPTQTNSLRILAVDGGGVRGIIPARILKEIETRTGKQISQLFNAGTGTSTGGLVVLGLSVPNSAGVAEHKAQDLIDLYLNDSNKIFSTSMLKKITTGFGLWGAKYSRSNLDNITSEMFGDLRLSQTLYPTYIPIYSIEDDKPYILNSKAAAENVNNDFYVRDVAGATTAAPTYFPPKLFSSISGNVSYTAADGGIYANDPEIVAAKCVTDMNQNFDVSHVILVSIGTGRVKHIAKKITGDDGIIGWLKDKNMIADMMDADMNFDEIIAGGIFKNNRYRLEVCLQPGMEIMDNASVDNLNTLLNVTEEFIKINNEIINEICSALTGKISGSEDIVKVA